MELTDHQTHLKSVTEQAQGLIKEIQDLETQAKNKRDMLLKLQGIIEYLTEIGVTLDDENSTDQSETVVEEASATEDETVES